MNRQVVTFLSLFSLVLVLSIYYVVDNQTPSDELVDKIEDENIDVTSSSYYFSTLILARDEKHQEIIDEQVGVIASNDSSSSEVVIAKETIKRQEDIMNLEEKLEGLIIECDCVSSYVEILDDQYLLKAYKPNLDLDDEISLVDNIFSKVDNYLDINNISFMKNLLPVVEIKY